MWDVYSQHLHQPNFGPSYLSIKGISRMFMMEIIYRICNEPHGHVHENINFSISTQIYQRSKWSNFPFWMANVDDSLLKLPFETLSRSYCLWLCQNPPNINRNIVCSGWRLVFPWHAWKPVHKTGLRYEKYSFPSCDTCTHVIVVWELHLKWNERNGICLQSCRYGWQLIFTIHSIFSEVLFCAKIQHKIRSYSRNVPKSVWLWIFFTKAKSVIEKIFHSNAENAFLPSTNWVKEKERNWFNVHGSCRDIFKLTKEN